ncbi:YbaN family protein [Pseudoruegeria sp. SK021]|uniref:YbaN family protein n=1 Tax=Pseudoruegeria sp. SK021 TaxID=1933035 RepID=UPI001F0B3220|nr:YbaN family protein [Pseudoruegeria sp. SK021]
MLPLLPTVPFMILAAYCFGKSSPKLHFWIINHPVFGPHIEDWQHRGAIRKKAKWLATGSMCVAFSGSILFGLSPTLLACQGAVLLACLGFIWSRPSG